MRQRQNQLRNRWQVQPFRKQEMQSVETVDKPSTTALALVPAQDLITADSEQSTPLISSRRMIVGVMPSVTGKILQPPGGLTSPGKQLPPLHATKEGKIYKIEGQA